MKKKFRILSLVCAVSMLLVMITGCGDKKASPDTSASVVSTTTSEETVPADTGYKQASATDAPTIVWWQIGTQPKNLADGVAKINEYIAEKIGVKIDIKVAGWGDYETKMNTIINTGEKFDIMFVNSNNYNRFINLKAFEDITEILPKEAPDLYSFIPQKVWDGTKTNSKIYCVPTYKDSSVTQYFVWDNAYVTKYKIDYQNIKTMQDLDKPFHDIKAGEGKSFYPLKLNKSDGLGGMFNDFDDMTLGLPPIGVKVDDASRTVVSTLEQPIMMDKLKLLHKWYKDGIVNPDAPTLGEAPKKKTFSTAQCFPGAEAIYQINEGVEKYVMTQVFGPLFSTSSIQGSLNAISANSKYKIESLKFLQAVNTDSKLRNLLAYGVEGVNWEAAGDNVIKKLNDVWSLPGYSQGTFFNLAAVAPNKGNQWDAVKELNEKAVSSVTVGFALDVKDLTTEITNCRAVWDKYKFDVLTGAADPEVVVPKMVKELKASGMDTIIAAGQKQINEFFK